MLGQLVRRVIQTPYHFFYSLTIRLRHLFHEKYRAQRGTAQECEDNTVHWGDGHLSNRSELDFSNSNLLFYSQNVLFPEGETFLKRFCEHTRSYR